MRKITFTLALFLCSILCAQAQTQGSLEAFNKKGQEIGACPLKNTRVRVDVSGFLARVTVTQEFENNYNQPIEAVYTFPLSQTAAVDQMTMLAGTRTIRGKIMRREEARRVYEAAKIDGKTASLLDQERPNIFTQSVANILPTEKITVEISYVETLKYEDGKYEFVFPMTITPRYIPSSVKPEDANKITPPVVKTRAGGDISIEMNLNAGVPIEEVRSDSHEIETLNLGVGNASVKLKNQNTIPNKDFVLRYDVTGKRIEDALLTHRDERGGFFTLILQPPDKFITEDVTPKEIVFVLDTSGSMSGFPIEKAKEAMKLSMENLYPNDTFNLITFSGDTAILFDKPVPATQANLEKAREFLASRRGYGGTEMMTAVRAALAPTDSQQHVRIVCFMTDGAVGNDAEIIAEVQKHKNARVFAFGIGSSTNQFLLDKIAEEGRGEVEYVALTDDGSKAAKRFYERVRTPLLTDVSIDWNGTPVADVYPNRIQDLFSAKPVIIHGRYTKGGKGTIKLKGKVGGQELVREIAVDFPETESRNDVLATLWARTRIDDLTKQDYKIVQDGNANPELQKTIADIGLEYKLLTQFTSFVAVEETIKTQGGQPTKVEVPVNLPEGISDENSEIDKMEIAVSVNRPQTTKTKRKSRTSSGRGSFGTNGRDGIGSSGNGGIGNAPNSVIVTSNMGYGSNSGSSGGNSPKPPPPLKISGGVLNGKATNLPTPAYPAAARAVRADGAVNVQITTDESGRVISVTAVSGHPLLRAAAEQAARSSTFAPTLLSGQPVKVTGVIVYNFTDPEKSANVNAAVSGTRPQTEAENLPTEAAPENPKRRMLAEKLHFWLYALVERLQKAAAETTANEAKFVRDGKAEIQIRFISKTPEAMEKLKTLGFETTNEKDKNVIVGRIGVEKIASLAEIAEVQYVFPELK